MRIHVAFILKTVVVTGLVACSGGVALGPDGGNGDDVPPPPPPTDGGIILTPDGGALPPPERGFQIVSPMVEIDPGDEVTYCFYFKTKNTTELAIQKWASRMTTGSHHMIVYLTPTDLQTPGTLSTRDCGFGASTTAVWTYSAQTSDAEAAMPADDGTGTPVGQLIKSGQSGFIQMHYLNASDNVLRAQVQLNAYAYAEDVRITPAAPFVTYDTRINLGPGSPAAPKPGMVTASCTVSPSEKFYVLSTHTHKQSVHTSVKDGAATVFDSVSWEHPGEETWNTAPFFSFTSGKLTYQCDYMNPTNKVITTGDSAVDNEMCMAIGYYFPAVGGKGHLCIDGNTLR